MANFQSDYAKGSRQMPVAQGAEVVNVHMDVAVPAGLALNDILEFGPLPQDHVPVDCVLHSTDIDTNGTPAVVLSAGLLNAGKTDISTASDDGGAAWVSGATVGQAATMVRPTTRALWTVAPLAATARMVGGKVTTAAATAAAGTVSLSLSYRAAHFGR